MVMQKRIIAHMPPNESLFGSFIDDNSVKPITSIVTHLESPNVQTLELYNDHMKNCKVIQARFTYQNCNAYSNTYLAEEWLQSVVAPSPNQNTWLSDVITRGILDLALLEDIDPDHYATLFDDIDRQVMSLLQGSTLPSSVYDPAYSNVIGDFAYPYEPASHVSLIARELPGMKEKVTCPALMARGMVCREHKKTPTSLFYMVQHLNDKHKWSREKIADWLDQLADEGKINIEF